MKFKVATVSFFVCVCILFCGELYLRIYDEPQQPKRIMLFEQGKNFMNVGDIFKYYPNRKIYNETWYVNNGSAKKEYNSTIYTNNLGLVQKRDITNVQDVDLIVGDSFAEGQGADPWFYSLDAEGCAKGKNFVNGAILGTSPRQWEILKNMLAEKYGLSYQSVNAIVLGGSTSGPVWNFSELGLQCLHNGNCRQPSGDFYGYSFSGKNEDKISHDVVAMYQSGVKTHSVLWNKLKMFFKTLKPSSSRAQVDDVITKNKQALKRLLESGRNPGFILLIMTKWEFPDKWSSGARWVMEFAQENNFSLFTCVVDPSGFHTQDGHPNALGYEKILQCAREATGMTTSKN